MDRWQILALGAAGGVILAGLAYREYVANPSLLTVMSEDDAGEQGGKGNVKKEVEATSGLQVSPYVKKLIVPTSYSTAGTEGNSKKTETTQRQGKTRTTSAQNGSSEAAKGGWAEDALAAVYSVAGSVADALLETMDRSSLLGKGQATEEDKFESPAVPTANSPGAAPKLVRTEGGRMWMASRNQKKSIYYNDITDEAKKCAKTRKNWSDPDMPPSESSLKNLQEKFNLPSDVVVQWHPPQDFSVKNRPQGVAESGKPTWLYVEENAAIPTQDADLGVGDSFTSAVLAAAQQHPFICDELILSDHEAQGIYGVALHTGGAWTLVWVDSFLPCYARTSAPPTTPWRLLCGGAHDRVETWAAVVVKAYAKLCGSYEAVVAHGVSAFLEHVFGGKGRTMRLSGLRGDKAHYSDVVWSAILSRGSLFVAAGTKSARETESSEGMNGILHGHTYIVLRAVEAAGVRLIQLRDPVARPQASKWTGSWSSSCAQWDSKEGKELETFIMKNSISQEEAGSFWMSFADFVSVFETVETCTVPRKSEEIKTDRELLAFAAESGGPSCLKPGLHMRVHRKNAQAAAEDMMRRLIDEEEKRKRAAGNGKNKKSNKENRASVAGKGKGVRKGGQGSQANVKNAA